MVDFTKLIKQTDWDDRAPQSSPDGILDSLDDLDQLAEPGHDSRLDTMVEVTFKDPEDVDCQLITGDAGTGKCLGLGTPVMMADGSIQPVENVRIGQSLMGPDSKPRKVMNISRGTGPLYRISPIKGDPWICNDVHIMTVVGSNNQKGEIRDIELRELLEHPHPDKEWKLFRVGVEFPAKPVPIDPYIAGAWLGDGTIDHPAWSLGYTKHAVLQYLAEHADAHDCAASITTNSRSNYWHLRYCAKTKSGRINPFAQTLKQHFQSGSLRRIPDLYLHNSREIRAGLLAGLLDTDGYLTCKGFELVVKDRVLADQVLYLARSLGLAAYASIKNVQLPGWLVPRSYRRISISGAVARTLPGLLRHAPQSRKQVKDVLRTGWKAEYIGEGDYYGFTLYGDGRFLLGDFTVTHNTYTVREMAKTTKGMKLCATTGIAAVNLDTATLNAVLKFFNTPSLVHNYTNGLLTRRLVELHADQGLRVLAIDEISMMPAAQLDVLYMALQAVNQRLAEPIRLILTGDFAQLPPVSTIEEPAEWCFTAPCWEVIGKNITKLTKVWRQSDPQFLAGLNLARRGQGLEAAKALRAAGVKYTGGLDENFPGTTIFAINRRVDEFNQARLAKIDKPEIKLVNQFKGTPKTEWKSNIPGCPGGKISPLVIKEGALVMILANDTEGAADGQMAYGNGDLGEVVGMAGGRVRVKLQRTGEEVIIGQIRRYYECDKGDTGATWYDDMRAADGTRGGWACGYMDWYPLRLGWATTVHKSQGLSLDNVQVDCRDRFFGNPNMAYVALSRARTPQGLRVVGGEYILAKQIKVDPGVRQWL